MKVNSYDIIAEKVREYWKETYPQDVIAFFYQKYDFESEMEWEWCRELISPHGSDDYERVIFENDFCEGQTDVKDVRIVPLDEIIDFYTDNIKSKQTERKALTVVSTAISKFRTLAEEYDSKGSDYDRGRALAYSTAADCIERLIENE
jgi:hypothetical protein